MKIKTCYLNIFAGITEGVKELKLHYTRRQVFLSEDLQPTAAALRRHNVSWSDSILHKYELGKTVTFFSRLVLYYLRFPICLLSVLKLLLVCILTFTYLMLPMENIVNDFPQLSKASVALQKIDSLGLSLADRMEVSIVPPAINSHWHSLELKEVTHAYGREQEENNFILGPVNLKFYPKELVFIVGGNGSGKSTLAKLITGLYTPEDGDIWLDGELITEDHREWYRQHFFRSFL